MTPRPRRAGRLAILLALGLLPGCLEQDPFGRLDRSELAVAARAPAMRGQHGAVLLVRITLGGRGCRVGAARVRTLASAIQGGPVHTIGQKRILERDPTELALSAQMRDIFGIDTMPRRHARVRAADVAYVALPPGDYIVTRIECEQDGRRVSMGTDYGDEAPPPGEVFAPVMGQNMITVGPGEIVDAGVLDITTRERGLFTTTAELVAAPTPEAYRSALAAALPDLSAQTVYRTFHRFSACDTIKTMGADAAQVAATCAKDAGADKTGTARARAVGSGSADAAGLTGPDAHAAGADPAISR